jgi:hypothetical protein
MTSRGWRLRATRLAHAQTVWARGLWNTRTRLFSEENQIPEEECPFSFQDLEVIEFEELAGIDPRAFNPNIYFNMQEPMPCVASRKALRSVLRRHVRSKKLIENIAGILRPAYPDEQEYLPFMQEWEHPIDFHRRGQISETLIDVIRGRYSSCVLNLFLTKDIFDLPECEDMTELDASIWNLCVQASHDAYEELTESLEFLASLELFFEILTDWLESQIPPYEPEFTAKDDVVFNHPPPLEYHPQIQTTCAPNA